MSTMREMGPVEAENQELRKRVAELEKERDEAQARAERLRDGLDEARKIFALLLDQPNLPHRVLGYLECGEANAAAALRGGEDNE